MPSGASRRKHLVCDDLPLVAVLSPEQCQRSAMVPYVYETWFSPEMDEIVLTKTTDPRTGHRSTLGLLLDL